MMGDSRMPSLQLKGVIIDWHRSLVQVGSIYW